MNGPEGAYWDLYERVQEQYNNFKNKKEKSGTDRYDEIIRILENILKE